ncbi:cytochrome P450 [Phytohabitans sp. ZYX-F-186]|uniref:Cytochrome P450 n=1 Tax=Phytohabitans maris TaxID=3071409 RepID=A0ABU0ZIU8_9ACTN|nr:cytochrome P450 [Phytohabitans sp. ZYX-F-186]MDQ7906302.1 cytochrome P450 [Phytohabitans sp. ZYX-F-186]
MRPRVAGHPVRVIGFFLEGYGWLPNRRRRTTDGVVRTHLLGQRVTGLCGPDAARFFYEEANVHRHGALPGPVQDTLFGRGGVHGLDGVDHRLRKAMFMSMLTGEGVALLERHAVDAWEAAAETWVTRDRVVLFDETARVLARAVTPWAGVPLDEADGALAEDLVSMVDGFATAGPRHWRARQARGRRERWLAGVVARARTTSPAPAGSALAAIAEHLDAAGEPLDPHVAAVELLNVLRPTVAVCWFVTFAAHALHLWPEHRDRLRDGDPAYAEAFAHELRRFYPFAPFVGGRAARDLEWDGHRIPAGSLVVLDIYGQNHHPLLWPDPYGFAPGRFLERRIGPYELIPQGGGDPRTGHRCPGETVTVALLRTLLPMLARLEYTVPEQDVGIPLHRIPTRPSSGMVLSSVRVPVVR